MFGTLLDYWHYTGDDQYNGLVREGLIHNFGESLDLVCQLATLCSYLGDGRTDQETSLFTDPPQMPNNQSKNEGNDDQVFWAFSMMSAAEYKLPDPPADKPGWLAMTQSVFNQFLNRYNKEVADGNCGGGLRWQVSKAWPGSTEKHTLTRSLYRSSIGLMAGSTKTRLRMAVSSTSAPGWPCTRRMTHMPYGRRKSSTGCPKARCSPVMVR
jgi:hypothetical protein